MSFLDAFNLTQATIPSASDPAYEGTVTPYSPVGRPDDECVWDWEREYNRARSNQIFQNSAVGGFISPYEAHWSGPVSVMGNLEELVQFQPVNKVDPNKIYNSDIAALRALGADQLKIVKLFETKLRESLTERGKIGLTEEDIEAMQALTAARGNVVSIQNAQVSIKKNIADHKIKQYQLEQTDNKTAAKQNDAVGGRPGSAFDVGRSILDNIFESALPRPSVGNIPTSSVPQATSMSSDSAGSVLDNLLSEASTVPDITRFESLNPTTYVVLGQTDDDARFETYSSDGQLIPDYPNPTARISNIDRESGIATDEYLINYKIKEE